MYNMNMFKMQNENYRFRSSLFANIHEDTPRLD